MPKAPAVRTATLAVFVVIAAAGCKPARAPVTLQEGTVYVENQTATEWRNVVVTVNDHFRGGAPSLPPGGRLTAPLSQFRTAFGQVYDRSRQSVEKIEVTATDANGKPVALQWHGERRQN
jgi:hypothetical protein